LIIDSINRLDRYCTENNYRGYDPYDALKSPLFSLPLLKDSKLIRFGAQQFVKRFPLNLRPLLVVPKGLNPVTLGLFIQGYSYLAAGSSHLPLRGLRRGVYPAKRGSLSPLTSERHDKYLENISYLINQLKEQISAGYHGSCWGYDFPWEARYASVPAYKPTIVATGIISNALYECFRMTGNETAKELCISSSDFVLHDLNRTYEEGSFCFSYSPSDKQQVFNASMKGARLLSQVYSLTKDEKLKAVACQAVQYVLNNQNSDGSWFYSKSGKGNWIDNYHTGYILDCLDEYLKCTDDKEVSEATDKGFQFYRNNFFEPGGRPKFYHNRSWPVDCTATAQSILTLCRFGDMEMAKSVAEYIIRNMQSSDGGFYFRKYKYHTEKTIFMRWSNAWMFAALALLVISDFGLPVADL